MSLFAQLLYTTALFFEEMNMSNYYFSTSINQPIDEAIDTLKATLHNHKLGIVSDVNVQAIVKNKLDEDMTAYRILGACNPMLAKRMIDELPQAGTLLPCTIIAREDGAVTTFDFMNPKTVLGLADNALMNEVAEDATARLKAVVADLSE